MGAAMGTAAGLANLVPIAAMLVGLVVILRQRRARRLGRPEVDAAFELRQGAAAEMERRMAAYLAQRDNG